LDGSFLVNRQVVSSKPTDRQQPNFFGSYPSTAITYSLVTLLLNASLAAL